MRPVFIEFLILIFHNFMYLWVYKILYMLPQIVILMCAFQLSLVELLVEVLLLLVVQEFYFLVYAKSDCIGCSFSVLLPSSIDLDADVFRFQFTQIPVKYKTNGSTVQCIYKNTQREPANKASNKQCASSILQSF
jgi:hypothetical protein